MDSVSDENFLLYAATHYELRHMISDEDFEQDLKRFQYLKRILTKFENSGNINIRLVLNNLMILYNCFGPACTDMLLLKLPEYKEVLKPFIVMLGYMPEKVTINGEEIFTSQIGLDSRIVKELRKI